MDVIALGYAVKTDQLDTATAKLDKMTDAAQRADKAADQLGGAAIVANKGVAATGKSADQAAGQMSKFGGATSNVFAQLNDIAVMMASGQSPMQLAMQQGMQLNQVWGQLGGNVKIIGRAIGGAFMSMLSPINLVTIGVIAFGSAAVNWLMQAGDAAKTMSETIDDLTNATDEYIAASERSRMKSSEMTAEFGRMEGAARAALAAIADAEKKAAIDALNESMRLVTAEALALETAMGSGGKGLEAAVFNMGLARDEAISLKSAFEALSNAGTLEAQAAAAVALSAELDAARDSAGNLPDPLQRAYDALQLAVVEAARISGETEKAEMSIWDFVSATLQGKIGLGAMSAEAASLSGIVAGAAQNMWNMAVAASQARNAALAAANAIPGMDNPDPNARIDYNKELEKTAFLTGLVTDRVKMEKLALEGAGKAGGGAGGKISKAMKDAEKATKEADKAAEELRKELEKPMMSAIEGVSSAWGDFVSRGFKDFKGFIQSVKDSFVQSIADMAAYAMKNQIMISMGLGVTGGSAAATAASATGGGGGLMGILLGGGSGGGGGLGGLVGAFSGGAGNVIGGLLSGGLGGAMEGLTGALSGISGGGLAGLAGAAGAIGAVVGGLALVASFFKSKKKLIDNGIDVTVKGLNTLVRTFSYIEKKKFWGLSKETIFNIEKAENELSNPIVKAVYKMQKAVMSNAKYLGIGADTFKNFTRRIWFSTKDMTKEQIQEKLQRLLTNTGNAFAGMIPGLKSMKRGGEGLMDTLSRVVMQLKTVNKSWRVLGFDLFDVSVKGAKAADQIVKIFGNVQNFLQATSFYFDKFYTDQEKIQQLRKQINAGFDAAGIGAKIPKSIKAYRDLVDRLEKQGRDKAVAQLIKLAPLFVGLQDALAGVKDEVDELRNALDPNDFRTLFAFQKANALWLNGTLKREPKGPSIYSAPTNNVASSASPAVSQSNKSNETRVASNAGAENNDALLLQLLQQVRKLVTINTDWDVNGMPDIRTA